MVNETFTPSAGGVLQRGQGGPYGKSMAQDLTRRGGQDEPGRTTVERDFWQKLKATARKIPVIDVIWSRSITCALDPGTPLQSKAVLLGALAYFIMPFDVFADFMPLLGFADDAAVLYAAIRAVAPHIKPDHRVSAKEAGPGAAEFVAGSIRHEAIERWRRRSADPPGCSRAGASVPRLRRCIVLQADPVVMADERLAGAGVAGPVLAGHARRATVPSAFEPVRISCWFRVSPRPLITAPFSVKRGPLGELVGVAVQFVDGVGDQLALGVVPGAVADAVARR